MLSIIINGKEHDLNTDGLANMAELIELVKSVIDPDHMITALLVDRRELSEAEWSSSLSSFNNAKVEISTGTPEGYVAERLAASGDIVKACCDEFTSSREDFQKGVMQEGNKKLAQAVNSLQAFFHWYATLMDLVPQDRKAAYDISDLVESISEVCKTICQQQLYQSWWALGESLKNDLEPQLMELQKRCQGFA